jgi:regulator of sirC expression with transglutaminase-like and TPR domain
VEDLQYIVDLWGDADPAVTAAVDRYFAEGGQTVLESLRGVYASEMVPSRKALLGKMLARYSKRYVIDALKDIARQSAAGDECSFLEAGYLLSALTDATLSREAYLEAVLPMAMNVMQEVSDSKTAMENVNLLNHVFYKRYGFSSTGPFEMTLDTSLLMNVARGRKGSPIALSLLYFIVAQSAGLPVYPLCFTGGFIPVYEEGGKILFNINVFHQGEIFMENNISKMVKTQAAALGVNVEIGEAVVRKDHSILVMYLEFIQMLYSNAGNSVVQMDIDDAIGALGGNRFLTIESDEDEW